jgi:hypothetical protein
MNKEIMYENLKNIFEKLYLCERDNLDRTQCLKELSEHIVCLVSELKIEIKEEKALTMKDIVDKKSSSVDISSIKTPRAIVVSIESDMQTLQAIAASRDATNKAIVEGFEIVGKIVLKIIPLVLI